MPRCAVNVDLSWPLNPSLLVSLKPGRQRLPWHLWHGLALHCGLNYWWRALLSQCVLPTFKWNSADWAVTAASLPQLLHDIYDAVQIAPKQLISSRACTQNEDPWQLPRAGFSMSTRHTHQYSTQKENIKICVKGVSGILWSFTLFRLSSGFQHFVFALYIFLKRKVDLVFQHTF